MSDAVQRAVQAAVREAFRLGAASAGKTQRRRDEALDEAHRYGQGLVVPIAGQEAAAAYEDGFAQGRDYPTPRVPVRQ